jgi:hypothetical protein
LRARIRQCWALPAGTDAGEVVVEIRMQLRKDGSLEVRPTVLTRNTRPMAQVVAETATRAIQMCAPYNFLPAAKYETWKDVIVAFDASWATRL